MTWVDNNAKVNFIENLLGEMEKRMFQQWRNTFASEYEALVNIADDPQNVLSQIRRIITLEDPYQGTTAAQERAYADLERLTCPDIKHIFQFMNEYMHLASRSGRMFLGPELSKKFFRKLPSLYGKEIEAAYTRKHPGNTIGVLPRIHFTHQYLTDMCKIALMQRGLKDLSFCKEIPIPGY